MAHVAALEQKFKVVKLVASEGAAVKAGDILLKIDTITAGYTERKSIVADADGILAENFADVEVLPPAQGDNFFGEANTALNNEVSAAMATVTEAENYFMRGEFLRAESLLNPFVGREIERANYMMCLMYEMGGDGIKPNNSAAVNFCGELNGDTDYVKAVEHHFKALKKDIPLAAKNAGIILKRGLGDFAQDFVIAKKYLLMSVDYPEDSLTLFHSMSSRECVGTIETFL